LIEQDATRMKLALYFFKVYEVLDWCSSHLFQKSELMERARLYIYILTLPLTSRLVDFFFTA
jgi:hypothetical protein